MLASRFLLQGNAAGVAAAARRNLSVSACLLDKAKKPKAEVILVACKSIASDHQRSVRRSRLTTDKVEFLAFDPEIQREVIYKEHHKIKSIREEFEHWYTKPSELKLPDAFVKK